jgi:hypothetical protein
MTAYIDHVNRENRKMFSFFNTGSYKTVQIYISPTLYEDIFS